MLKFLKRLHALHYSENYFFKIIFCKAAVPIRRYGSLCNSRVIFMSEVGEGAGGATPYASVNSDTGGIY